MFIYEGVRSLFLTPTETTLRFEVQQEKSLLNTYHIIESGPHMHSRYLSTNHYQPVLQYQHVSTKPQGRPGHQWGPSAGRCPWRTQKVFLNGAEQCHVDSAMWRMINQINQQEWLYSTNRLYNWYQLWRYCCNCNSCATSTAVIHPQVPAAVHMVVNIDTPKQWFGEHPNRLDYIISNWSFNETTYSNYL